MHPDEQERAAEIQGYVDAQRGERTVYASYHTTVAWWRGYCRARDEEVGRLREALRELLGRFELDPVCRVWTPRGCDLDRHKEVVAAYEALGEPVPE